MRQYGARICVAPVRFLFGNTPDTPAGRGGTALVGIPGYKLLVNKGKVTNLLQLRAGSGASTHPGAIIGGLACVLTQHSYEQSHVRL